MHNINEKLFFLINGAVGQSNFLDNFFLFVTNYFVEAMIVISFFWFFIIFPIKNKKPTDKLFSYKVAGLFTMSLMILWSLVVFIKGFVAFPRPLEMLDGVKTLSFRGGYDSFPSLHTAFAFCIAIFVYKYSKTSGVIALSLATLVGVSRIFVGVHYPLDVLCGAIIGAMVPIAIIWVFRRSKV